MLNQTTPIFLNPLASSGKTDAVVFSQVQDSVKSRAVPPPIEMARTASRRGNDATIKAPTSPVALRVISYVGSESSTDAIDVASVPVTHRSGSAKHAEFEVITDDMLKNRKKSSDGADERIARLLSHTTGNTSATSAPAVVFEDTQLYQNQTAIDSTAAHAEDDSIYQNQQIVNDESQQHPALPVYENLAAIDSVRVDTMKRSGTLKGTDPSLPTYENVVEVVTPPHAHSYENQVIIAAEERKASLKKDTVIPTVALSRDTSLRNDPGHYEDFVLPDSVRKPTSLKQAPHDESDNMTDLLEALKTDTLTKSSSARSRYEHLDPSKMVTSPNHGPLGAEYDRLAPHGPNGLKFL